MTRPPRFPTEHWQFNSGQLHLVNRLTPGLCGDASTDGSVQGADVMPNVPSTSIRQAHPHSPHGFQPRATRSWTELPARARWIDDTRKVQARQLHDDIGDTLASLGGRMFWTSGTLREDLLPTCCVRYADKPANGTNQPSFCRTLLRISSESRGSCTARASTTPPIRAATRKMASFRSPPSAEIMF
jgi:hypothetical protein